MSSAEAALRELLDQIRTRIDRHGWAVVSTESPEPGHGGAPLAYTLGCSRTFGRPEALILGLPPYLARGCLDRLVERWRDGEPDTGPAPGGPVAGIMEGLDVVLRPVPAERAATLLRAAPYFIPDPFATLQLVWPDGAGRFPWDPDCDPAVVTRQPALGDPPSGSGAGR